MEKAEAGWGKYALETVHSREEAEERDRYWTEQAELLPNAQVKVLSWRDPLGGETFIFCTETLELVPERLRISTQEALARLQNLRRRLL